MPARSPLCLVASLSLLLAAPGWADSLGLTIDNDGAVLSDRDYSSGLFVTYASAPLPNASATGLPRALGQWLPALPHQRLHWDLTLGHMIWTPDDIEAELPPPGERPYAALLFLQGGLARIAPSQADRFHLLFGTVGPRAGAESIQEYLHLLIGSDDPNGWDSQVRNRWVANLDHRGDTLLHRQSGARGRESSLQYRLRLGNVTTELALGGLLRWGQELDSSFASAGLEPGRALDAAALPRASGQFLYLGVEARYRLYDITLEGALPGNVPDADREPLQGSLALGYAWYRATWGLGLRFEGHSRAYEQADQPVEGYASLTGFWRFN